VTSSLRVDLNGLTLDNPLIMASGTFGLGDKHRDIYSHAGAFISKTTTYEPREGNPPVRIVETPSGIVNRVGLENPGFQEFYQFLQQIEFPTTFIVSVDARDPERLEQMIAHIDRDDRIAGFEINLSCPNIEQNQVMPSFDEAILRDLLRSARSTTDRWICAKVPPYSSIEMGPICEEYEMDALCVSNTYPSVAFGPEDEPIQGGLSGPAVKPMTQYNVVHTEKRVSIPVIASGGINTVDDVFEYFRLGAEAVQLGSVNFVRPNAVKQFKKTLSERLEEDREPWPAGMS